ncbi:contact-dependent growth inhibition system immunity protein [Streptomyces sp. SAS_270]|uniref:contact-dependent growth inhibition system immunity protein n=1 Tax=Streptomyces sp. SAS_270 TaxID=3412748 RepID=UPI00403D1B4C
MTESPDSSPHREMGEKLEFQEIWKLLQAYEWTRGVNHARDGSLLPPGDLDTPDSPSRAMRTYLRMAARTPGSAARVVAELELLLERGPEDDVLEALDDVGVEPEQLRPSDGKDPDEFFELMLVHLRAFIAAGEHIEDAVPESGWEWRERYGAIRGLMAGAFHVDCLYDFPDRDAVLEDHIQGEQVEHIEEMLSDIDDLRIIAPTDDDLEWALRGIGHGLLTPKGMTAWQWMEHIEARLRRYVRESGN